MKKELMVLLMLVTSAMIISAEGKQDDDYVQYRGRGPGMMGRYELSDEEIAQLQEEREAVREEFLASLETVSLSGSLSLINGQLPFIEQNGTTYYFMAPWHYLDEIELTDGMEITVEGYELPGQPLQWDDSEKRVMVTGAVINGEQIEVEHPMDGYGYRGGFGQRGGYCGPFGGRGNRGGGFMNRKF